MPRWALGNRCRKVRRWSDGRNVPRIGAAGTGGLVGVPYNPLMIVLVVAELMLIALMITAFGVMVMGTDQDVSGVHGDDPGPHAPDVLLIGGVVPLNNLPTWLTILTHINPSRTRSIWSVGRSSRSLTLARRALRS